MFGNDQPTPFDLKFRLAGIPVRVSPWFWIVTLLLGSNSFHNREIGPIALVIWVASVFVSILLHEMGHALAFKCFGCRSEVSLYAMGGLARPYDSLRSPVKSILVSLAGPGAGFLFFGLLVGSQLIFPWAYTNGITETVFFTLAYLNLIWGLFNLLPIWPLDGGQVCRELYVLAKLRNPASAIHLTSMIAACSILALGLIAFLRIGLPADLGALNAVVNFIGGSPFVLLYMAFFAFMNYQLWQQTQRRGYYYEDDNTPPWRRN